MHLRLNKLIIENFAGIKDQTFEFIGDNSKIYGSNGAGKTTTATALQWLLFDKGLDGSTKSFNPVPVDISNHEVYELIPTVEAEFTIDNNTLVLRKESRPKYTTNLKTNRKEYSRSRTKRQFINEEPVKISDYKSRIKDLIDEDVFKLITNPAAFNNLDWKKRREILFEIADPIDDEDIIKSNDELSNLRDLLREHDIETKKKIVSDKIKQINKEIQDIPTRINQESKGLQEVEPLNDSELKQIESEIESLKQQKIEVKNGSKSIELKNKLAELEGELSRLKSNHNFEIDNKIHVLTNEFNTEQSTVLNYTSKIRVHKQEIEHEEKRRKALLSDYKMIETNFKELQDKQFEYTATNLCATCGQKLPADQIESVKQKAIEKFNKEKSADLEVLANKKDEMLNEGKKIKPVIEKIQSEIDKYQKYVEDASKKSEKIKKQIDKFKEKQTDVTETEAYRAIVSEIEEIKQEQQNIQESISSTVLMIDEQINDLYVKKSKFDERLMIIESNKRSEQRIKDLRAKEDNLLDEKEECAHQLYQLNLFTTTKINMLTDNINEKFDMAEFKLFNQLVNGELEETCITLVEGVEYGGGLNNAARINVGLDIINTLCRHYNVTAPIFIDNAESVTDIIKTDAQQIQLIVSENSELLVVNTGE
ncbi:ATP-binding protein [Staphylococcus pseudintermedius]|uniref:ATP-binding protein n=1 Tax=Staphylococcus pseudintermedius TaxID=283734 RepID=UPI000C1B9185|nr:AAA family ATPase [Staphylococcus pseudintermedius]ELI4021222.1 AAA family ATPase [Staphylococcus pseudintermedius]ELN1786741.1 AAA family ATPase [Staphylococcus pseudintermedius]MDU9318465.1 AAA family ATPase [Staphylococcus pseudintermedius]HCT0519417.1 AAA family ATPase [Staphylococcus pseudintermedius]HDU1318931.1 AAA family ATPase [Staphylococcus pseudintermedius]